MGQNKYNPNPRTYSKTNFVELVELITPEVYKTEDLKLSGIEVNPLSQIINSNIQAANTISTVLSISAVANSQTSTLDNISGISQYFVKQNELTKINPYLFETKILLPISSTLSNFDTSSEFNDYLSGTLLPKIRLFQGDSDAGSPLWENISELSSFTNNNEASSVHNYLVDNLGWFYFLNTSADGGLTWDPSGYVLSSLNKLYLGESLDTNKGVKGFTEYLWRNYETCSFGGLIPGDFVSGAADAILDPSDGIVATYTSGVQKLENLLTLVDAVYSPLYIDQQDFTVKDAFDNYIDASLLLSNTASKGPLRKFENMLGFSFADVTDQVENIGLIYDIENVKDEHLQYIADLIGWRLRGASPSKWRNQLRVAIDIYKKSGTLAAIQAAIDCLIVDSVFDVSGQVQELWESYIPFLIWYALGTESPLFKNLKTWNFGLAQQAGIYTYNSSSLEGNLKIVTDSILLDLYKAFPDNFIFHGHRWDPPRLYELDEKGCITKLYTVVGENGMKPFHIHRITDDGYQAFKQDAKLFGELTAWEAAESFGPLGQGVYMGKEAHPQTGERPLYLSATGDINFVFNYRDHFNYPIPPFEEIKYYRDCTITADLVNLLVEKLKCFQVKDSFAEAVGSFILEQGVTTTTNLGSLNEFLMLFSSVQVPSNYDDVLLNSSNYEKNLLGLWNGKSSHLFIDFDDTDFDFSKTTLEGDSKYALYEAARISREFSPGHAITRVNLNASAEEPPFVYSSTDWDYLGFDKDDTRESYTSASVISNFEYSGVAMGTIFPTGGGDSNLGGNDGRGGLNTFKRVRVDNIKDTLLSSTDGIFGTATARRALRRRNFRYTLPKEGYYDRTGFNGPVNWEASSLENSMPSSLGELTLGYVASAGEFYPIVDPINPSGVWHFCEKLDSSRTFSGIDTSNTFPYRGLSSVALNNNAKYPEFSPSTTQYVDRGQTPPIYITMHELFETKARDYAFQEIQSSNNSLSHESIEGNWQTQWMASSFASDAYWKNQVQSFANSAIASGLVLTSYDDYLNFKFGKELQKLYRDYCETFQRHDLSLNDVDKTGANIFAQVFGLGLYNCNFSIEGSAVSSTLGGDYIASSFSESVPIGYNNGSGVFSTCAVAAYSDGTTELPASGTYIASDAGQMVIPISGTFTSGNPLNAEFRNPHLLSGMEFVQPSGAAVDNQFRIFKVAPQFSVKGQENYLVDNTVIKCKSVGGLPRLIFNLSSYGDRPNTFIKDHKFKVTVNSLVAEENSRLLGGGKLGIWIHTGTLTPTSNQMWSWTPKGKWELHEETDLSEEKVLFSLAHIYEFPLKLPEAEDTFCLGNIDKTTPINDLSLADIKEKYFESIEVEFDTRNYTIHNNFEYLDIIPVPEVYYKNKELVHTSSTEYFVEVFFVANKNSDKYMLIDSIGLQDLTLRDYAGIGTGHGIRTKGIPLRPFVKEDKLYLEKDQLRDVLKFYNGLIGQGTGLYATNISSRDATITSGILEVSGGSRLNYRVSPEWVPNTKQANFNNYTSLELDN
jgi:hypothetical protein